MLALIDGDVICYQTAFVTENDEEYVAKTVLRNKIKEIVEKVGADEYEIWLTDSKENWRQKLFPLYKANRRQPKPKHYHMLLNNMVYYWGAQVAIEEEADDALGIRQTALGNSNSSCICTIDKDLQQIPGLHFNTDKFTLTEVLPLEGTLRFYTQLLVGDSGDNITPAVGLSCAGVGKKKAEALLEGCFTSEDMEQVCYDAYMKGWADLLIEEINEKFILTGQLVKIRTEEKQIWQPQISLLEPLLRVVQK